MKLGRSSIFLLNHRVQFSGLRTLKDAKYTLVMNKQKQSLSKLIRKRNKQRDMPRNKLNYYLFHFCGRKLHGELYPKENIRNFFFSK